MLSVYRIVQQKTKLSYKNIGINYIYWIIIFVVHITQLLYLYQLDGNLERVAHTWRIFLLQLFYFMLFKYQITSTGAHLFLSYHAIYLPWLDPSISSTQSSMANSIKANLSSVTPDTMVLDGNSEHVAHAWTKKVFSD